MPQTAAATPSRLTFGHPKGLWVLAGTELWDRISFHGMQAMLVLYMTGELLVHPTRLASIIGFAGYRHVLEGMTGPLSPQALATQTFGLYLAMVTGLPVLFGWLGDRYIGRRTAVAVGAVLMTAGHFSLAFDRTFLIALILLFTGAGLLRGNLSPQIRALYPPGDRREGDAFQVYAMAVNFGAFIAPIVTGAVAAVWGWHAGFAVAGFGMLIGLVYFLAGQKWLPEARRRKADRSPVPPLTRQQKKNLFGLVLMWPFAVAFWTAQAQIWNVYNVWLRDRIDLDVAGFRVPVPWFQSLDGLAPTAFGALAIWLWTRQARAGKEPDAFTKIGFGLILFGLSVALLATAPLLANSAGKGPIYLPVLFHLVSNLAAVYYSPVNQAWFAARSPDRWRGTMLGFNSLSVSAASLISGRMGQLYETMSPAEFWLINAALCGGMGLLMLLIAGPFLRRWFGPEVAEDNPEDAMPMPAKEDTGPIPA